MPQTTRSLDLPLWKKILFSLILVVGFPVALLLAIEGAGYAYLHFKYGVPGKTYGLWTYDEEFGAIHAANAYNSNSETNSLGFRNKEDVIEPRPPGSYLVIANPRWNEFEGTVEMADWTVLRLLPVF